MHINFGGFNIGLEFRLLNLTVLVVNTIITSGSGAIQSTMSVGAIPFSFIMILMGISIFKALIRDSIRGRESEGEGEATEAGVA